MAAALIATVGREACVVHDKRSASCGYRQAPVVRQSTCARGAASCSRATKGQTTAGTCTST
eukprot:10988201-Alexandrium_andersonii.AAC.1